MRSPTLVIVPCPECGASAEIVDRFILESTEGPVEHAVVMCIDRHRLTMLVESMARRHPVVAAGPRRTPRHRAGVSSAHRTDGVVMSSTEQHGNPVVATAAWAIHGDPVLLVDAARKLRLGIAQGVYRSHPPGEYAMFGLARLLDAIAFSMHIDGAVHHTVVDRATALAPHGLTPRVTAGRGRRWTPNF